MIKLGEKQILKVVRMKDFGMYVGDETEAILLPRKYVPVGTKVGDSVEVFVYRDSSDRLIATTEEPALTLGQVASLKVKETGKIGAFLDWGLEKDLLLPFKEQSVQVRPGKSYPVALYIDKSKRLCATMKIYEYLSSESPYEKDAVVQGIVYQVNPNIGVFVAVDGKYHGMIPKKNAHGNFKVGDPVQARVVAVREDGKLELSVRERVEFQISKDAETLIEVIESYDGVLPFTEKASPAVIERELNMSKAAFKRAVGHLLKAKKIRIDQGKIRANTGE
ncbi:S1 RNA-binding domain-containing protein [Frisingicoccus sp.]|uniref:CvfB family protein n=1 Tax=Frisingicoccus sp. TaxID=1918627 RepID=UPI002EAB3E16|nr:S1-like domain-containing RNA-binding protein [Frisingicoccus sp.]